MNKKIKEDIVEILIEIALLIKNIIFYVGFPIVLLIIIGVFATFCDSDTPKDNYSSEDAIYEDAIDQMEEDKGRRDAASLSCEMARDFIGEEALVKGSVESIYYAEDSEGKPIFIDLDYEYPDDRRVTLIIWEENQDKLSSVIGSLDYKDIVYVNGLLEEYDGAVQIEVSDADQIEVE